MHIPLSILLICCSLALGACGKKGSLYVEEDAQTSSQDVTSPPPASPQQ
ncbi:hypothetical protein [Thiomicrorhabdus sp.]|nr:hypothetical protein [Thiomicrorhabdus sp.]